MKILVTGSSGPLGFVLSAHFAELGHDVHGVDDARHGASNGLRSVAMRDRRRAQARLPRFFHHELDTDDRSGVLDLFSEVRPDAVVHAATPAAVLAAPDAGWHAAALSPPVTLCCAEPRAGAAGPPDHADAYGTGTLNLLEATRRTRAATPFVFLSTKRIYTEGSNQLALRELESRWVYADARYARGISESFPVDPCHGSRVGGCKMGTDVMVQEYGHYFGLPTVCLRLGKVVGAASSLIHPVGYLADLVRANVHGHAFPVAGGTGKHVRDFIHAFDVARFIHAFVQAPRAGAVYNIGGGRPNACSIVEAIDLIEGITGEKQRVVTSGGVLDGDQRCYFSDLGHAKADYPSWDVTISLRQMMETLAAEPLLRRAAFLQAA